MERIIMLWSGEAAAVRDVLSVCVREREREREILVFVRNKSFLVVALGGERVENTDEIVKDLRS